MTNTKIDYKKIWSDRASKAMEGAIVKEVRWMTQEEVENNGWLSSAPTIIFTNGLVITASMDDEGNDAGALFTNFKSLDLSILPRI